MKALFADTFYFLALLSRRDDAHARASAFDQQGVRIVTTEWVLTEVADGFAAAPQRSSVAAFIQLLGETPEVEVAAASHDLFRRGLKLYAERPDKEWSLTDCISFVVMRERGLTNALTADHHFEQAGFKPLLK